MPSASIVIPALAVLATLIAAVLGQRGLSTLNNRIRLHVELIQHAPSGDLQDLLDKEVADVVRRDRLYLERKARFYLIQGLLLLGMGIGIFGLIVYAVGLIDAIRQGVPYSPGLRSWLPIGASFALIGLGVLLIFRTPAPATATAKTKDVVADADPDDAKTP